ncbi:NAD-dependent epimerase/dehydratase family protein [Paractinoplanes ovalisporus]|uniref:NAD-dependent epimerase/dehydratase family protein n=1 Tax=Paractinoplanes ovalisporus TaxID=2810368 RepID=UPI0027DD5CF6|nr:NAD(P)-dependent oxidoreductase [Actinoplanes ovalisporus]
MTGSSGLVGSVVSEALEADGWSVTGVDRAPGRWTSVVGDLRDRPVREAALQGSDAVVHAAARHAPHVGRVDDREFRAVNVDATEALLEATGDRRFVYISTTSVYGHSLVPTDRAVWVDESLPPRPRDIYDETKLAAEALVTAATTSVVLRIARCFPEPPPVLAAHLLHRAVHPADVAAAAATVTERSDVTGVFTIAGPYAFTRVDCPALHHDAAALIAERLPEVAEAFRTRGWSLSATIDRVYDSTAAAHAFGYRPAYGVHQALAIAQPAR